MPIEFDRYSNGIGPDCLIFPATPEEKKQHGSDTTWIPITRVPCRPLPATDEVITKVKAGEKGD
jgi:hypothetical protein